MDKERPTSNEKKQKEETELGDEELDEAGVAGGVEMEVIEYQDGEDIILRRREGSTSFQDGEDIILRRK